MSDRSQIDEIKERLDIVSVVQEYVPSLKKSGRNYFAVCPFHQEKSPSFSVNSEMGLFKCFGCGEGGDVIKFIERIEGLDFPHALENAAKRAGVTLLKHADPKLKKEREEKERVIEANKLACKYFNYILEKHKAGEIGRKYSDSRKITTEGIKEYQLGFAPVGFENLKDFMLKKGYKADELVKWGLLVSKKGRVYDKFRNRLMFPILDHQGDVVGFSGRAIDKEEKGPKYLNSPETPVYNKSKLLFGLYQAKEFARKEDFVIVVEGNIDIISSYQAGVKNIVAPLGTALTEDQLKLLKRYSTKVYFSFDTDLAGQKALLRSLELAEKTGLQAMALDIGKFQDVDELITSGGDWQKVVANAKPVIDFLIKTLAKNYDLEDSKQKSRYANQVLQYIKKINDGIEKADYVEKLSRKSKVPREKLYEMLDKISAETISQAEDARVVNKAVFKLDEETYFLAFILQHPQWIKEVEDIEPGDIFLNADNLKIFELVKSEKKLPNTDDKLYQNLIMSDIEVYGHKYEFVQELKTARNRLRKAFIKNRMKEIEMSEDESLLGELKELSSELGKLL